MNDERATSCETLLGQLSALEPSPRSVARALARARTAIEPSELPEPRKRASRNPVVLMAITVIVALAVTTYLLVGFAGRNAFAQVQSALQDVPSVSFKVDVLASPPDTRADSGVATIDLEGDRYRFESDDNTLITIDDRGRGVFLVLDLVNKRAVVTRTRGEDRIPSFADFLKAIRSCDPKWVEELPGGEIDGRHVHRFRIRAEAHASFAEQEIVVSVDPETHLLLQFDTQTDALGAPLHIVGRAFSYASADPSLFSTRPPADFEVDDGRSPANAQLAE